MKPTFDFNGSTVVVTGGRGAIGSAIISKAHSSGAHVIGVDVTGPKSTDTEGVVYLQGDLSTWNFSTQVAKYVAEETTGTIGLVLCTQYQPRESRSKRLDELSPQLMDDMQAAHIHAYQRPAHQLMPLLVSRGGNVVIFTSINWRLSNAGNSSYTPLKALEAGLVTSMALDYAELGIHVNGIAPGAVDTPGNRAAAEDQGGWRILEAAHLDGQVITSEACAEVTLWLLSQGARFVTGNIIDVSGTAHLEHSYGAFGRGLNFAQK